jgi:hypothetical protein
MSGAATTDFAQIQHALRRPGALPAHTVYECPECGDRLVGQQRCQDCGRFGQALGLGGSCCPAPCQSSHMAPGEGPHTLRNWSRKRRP